MCVYGRRVRLSACVSMCLCRRKDVLCLCIARRKVSVNGRRGSTCVCVRVVRGGRGEG